MTFLLARQLRRFSLKTNVFAEEAKNLPQVFLAHGLIRPDRRHFRA
jgi:hypothetical protein